MDARRTRTNRHAAPAPVRAATPQAQCSRRGSDCTPFPDTTEGIVIRQGRPAEPRALSETHPRRRPGLDSDAPVIVPDTRPERRVVLTAPGSASLHGRRPLRTPAIAFLGRAAPILAAAFLVVGAPDRSALAQSEPTLTIAASQQSYAFGVDNVEFTVTRNGAADEEISGTLTLAQDEDFLDTNFLRLDFTIAADETSTDMMAADEKSTNIVLSAALFDGDATQSGDLTATIDAGDGYTVGTPGTVTARMVVADSSITVRPEHAAYSFDEDDAAASVTFVAGTAPDAPRPSVGFSVTVSAKARSDGAGSPHDYAPLSEIIRFDPADFDESGDEWEARKEVALSIVDDGEAEDDEAFDLNLEGAPGLSTRIKLRQADGTVCPDEGCLTPVTIVDNEVPAVVATHDTATTPVDTAVEVPVLENDTYVGRNGHLLGVSKVTGSVHGTTRINEDRTGAVFVPDPGYSGIARFTYTVTDETLTDTAAVIVAVGGAAGAGAGVPVWEARWSSTGSGGCTAFSLGVVNTNSEATPAEDEHIAVTLHVDRQRSTLDDKGMEVKDASAAILERHPFTPNIHHDGAWVYVVGTTAGALSTVMTVEPAGAGEPPRDGAPVARGYGQRGVPGPGATTSVFFRSPGANVSRSATAV
ncbi:MAG: Ig-like domain-containing protein [Thiotrichales bacterium]|nr:Ig-like domain-containing protein [Thiotrichales bacterium]